MILLTLDGRVALHVGQEESDVVGGGAVLEHVNILYYINILYIVY